MPQPAPPPYLRYLSALVSVALVSFVQVGLFRTVGERSPYIAFLFAVIFTAWYGGLGPSVLSAVLATLCVIAFFLPFPSSQVDTVGSSLAGLGMFLLVNTAIILFAELNRGTHRKLEREVSDRRRAEQSERAQREQLQTTLFSVGDGVIVTDREGKVVSLNPVAENLTGWATSESIGRNLREVFRTLHQDTHRTEEMPVLNVVSGRVSHKMDQTELITRGGPGRAIEHCTTPMKDDREAISGVVIVFRDITERNRADAALRESERRLKQLADTMPQIVWTAGPNGAVDYFNGRWYEYTGMTQDQSLSHEGWSRLIHPDDIGLLTSVREKAVGEGGVFEAEIRLRDRRGEYRWHLVRSIPVSDELGRVVRRFGAATDIDDRKRAEAELRSSNERLELAQYVGHIGTFEWDLVNGRIDWSASQDALFGGVVGGFGGRFEDWKRLVYKDDRLRAEADTLRAVAERSELRTQFRIVRSDGEIRWVSALAKVWCDETGQPIRMIGVNQDITETKRLEEESVRRAEDLARLHERTAESLALLDTVFDSSPVGFAYLDRELRFRRINSAFAAMNEMPLAAHYHRRVREILPQHADDLEPVFLRVLETGQPQMNLELGRETGAPTRIRYSLVNIYPVRARDEVVGVGMASVDITDRKLAEESLREADRRKDEFLATLAHELRNPLAPIRNALLLMKHEGRDDHEHEADRSMAERQVFHLSRLVDDLMDISRVTRGKIELRKQHLDLATVVQRAVETVKSSMLDRRQTLSISLPDKPVRLDADPTRLEQVLWNLLINAIKYTDQGGHIEIEVETLAMEAVLKVRDNGIGIKADMLPHVFEMFVQAEHRADSAHGGLGIGLSLVKTLVEMHGGRIAARSQGERQGSEFSIYLPLLEPANDTGALLISAPSITRSPLKRRRILVVDDNVDAAESLARLLGKLYGQDVYTAHDGPEALIKADELRPDVILLDIGMPGMDGYEVSRQLRARSKLSQMMIVALTGWGQESDRHRSREAGFDLHFVKPVDPEVLLEHIESRLNDENRKRTL